MEWAEHLPTLRKEWKTSGKKPDALKRRPQLNEADLYYYNGFWELSKSRDDADKVGNIPVSEFESFFNVYYITNVCARRLFMRQVGKIDSTFVEAVNKKRAASIEKQRNQGSRKTGGKLSAASL